MSGRPLRGRRVALHPSLGWIGGALAAVMFAAGVATVLYTVAAIFRLHVVLPVWDEWMTVSDAQSVRAGTYGWAELTRQYNEHRLLVPRLFFIVDNLLFDMSDRFNLAVMFLFQAVNAAVLIRLMMRLVADRVWRLLLAGFVLLVLFSLRQEQNFTFGFQLQFIGVFTFGVLAITTYVDALDRLGVLQPGSEPRPGAWMRLAVAGLLCAASTYTMANGVTAGFTLLVLALALRAPWRVVLPTLVFSAVLAGLYFQGLDQGGMRLPLSEALADPLAYPRFLAGLLGNLLGSDIDFDTALGAVGLAGFAAAGLGVAIGRTRHPASVALLAVAGFMAASACATTYGRIGVGILQAFEGRYVEPAAIFWCALLLFWFPVFAGAGAGRGGGSPLRLAGLAALACTAASLTLAAAYFEATAWPDMVKQAAGFHRFRDSLLSGLFDTQAGGYEIFTHDDMRPGLTFLQDRHLSLFGTPEALDVGRPVAASGAAAPASACRGEIAARSDPQLGTGGVRLRGTAWDEEQRGPVRRILLASQGGIVAGLGSPERPEGRPRNWFGYAKAEPGSTLAAYAVLKDGRACPFGTVVVAPAS